MKAGLVSSKTEPSLLFCRHSSVTERAWISLTLAAVAGARRKQVFQETSLSGACPSGSNLSVESQFRTKGRFQRGIRDLVTGR